MTSVPSGPAARGPAIVTTLRRAGPLLDGFIAWHQAIGFGRLYLVFDDPDDPDLRRVADHPAVCVLPADAALRRAWTQTALFADMGASIDQEVMARQVLNAAVVMERARRDGHDWLLHIDIDELFLPPAGSARAYFDALASQPLDVVRFPNLEAVPEADACPDPVAEVTLFKVPVERMRAIVQREPALADALRASPRFGAGFFNLYSNGKSAVRLSAPGLRPEGVHAFDRPGGGARAATATDAVILHYACCGLDAFVDKYRLLGAFPDRWWNRYDIAAAIGPFHLQARDVVATGSEAQIADFYRRRIAMGPDEAAQGLEAGLLTRISGPARLSGARG